VQRRFEGETKIAQKHLKIFKAGNRRNAVH
jgi:hypothetical protein